jgi:hypothetical protein
VSPALISIVRAEFQRILFWPHTSPVYSTRPPKDSSTHNAGENVVIVAFMTEAHGMAVVVIVVVVKAAIVLKATRQKTAGRCHATMSLLKPAR